MTMLHVIRHGRATALEANYDQLHAMGELQARALGVHLGRAQQRFDAVYVGPLKRQLETFRLMRESAGAVGSAWPEAQVLDELAEGPYELLFKKYARKLATSDALLQARVAGYLDAGDDAARDRTLSELTAHVIGKWRRGEVLGEDLETALEFEARVTKALGHIAAREGRGREVAVVTSNGVILNVLAQTRGFVAADGHFNSRVRNSSVSRIEVVADGFELRAHDLTDHLTDPEHLTTL